MNIEYRDAATYSGGEQSIYDSWMPYSYLNSLLCTKTTFRPLFYHPLHYMHPCLQTYLRVQLSQILRPVTTSTVSFHWPTCLIRSCCVYHSAALAL